jgi:hypothetical protein
MEIGEENPENAAPFLEPKIDKLLDELGAEFKAAWKSVEDIDPASDDGKVLYAALDRQSLSELSNWLRKASAIRQRCANSS